MGHFLAVDWDVTAGCSLGAPRAGRTVDDLSRVLEEPGVTGNMVYSALNNALRRAGKSERPLTFTSRANGKHVLLRHGERCVPRSMQRELRELIAELD